MLTDPQPETGAEVDFIREDLIEALAGVNATFGLTAGDIMFDDLSLYPRHNAIIGTIGLPWWNIGGNHDLNLEAPDRNIAARPTSISSVRATMRSSTRRHSSSCSTMSTISAPIRQSPSSGKYEGRLDERQLEFVRGVLEHTPDDTLMIAVLHIPIKTSVGDEPWQNLANKEALFELFEGRKDTVSFAGHTHTTEHHYFDAADGWKGPRPTTITC